MEIGLLVKVSISMEACIWGKGYLPEPYRKFLSTTASFTVSGKQSDVFPIKACHLRNERFSYLSFLNCCIALCGCQMDEKTLGGVPFWVSSVHRNQQGGSVFWYQVGPIRGVKNNMQNMCSLTSQLYHVMLFKHNLYWKFLVCQGLKHLYASR